LPLNHESRAFSNVEIDTCNRKVCTMRNRLNSLLMGVLLSAIVAGCATPHPSLPPPPVHANGQVLWQIVHDHCLTDERDHGNPSPCTEVSITAGINRGYAVLKDRDGVSQYLVMPTIRITGIEDAQLLRPDATDYFSPAWRVRQLVAQRLVRTLTRADVGIAVNSIYGRTQDLLHLHVDCINADVRDALRRAAPAIGHHWGRHPIMLDGHRYRAIRVDGDDLVAADPFRLLAQGLSVGPGDMGAWTLLLAGMDFPDGKPGFLLLAARAEPSAGFSGSAEELQDHSCAGVGQPGPP
jgi:CDP-diacylglycerol pyrophosphatase